MLKLKLNSKMHRAVRARMHLTQATTKVAPCTYRTASPHHMQRHCRQLPLVVVHRTVLPQAEHSKPWRWAWRRITEILAAWQAPENVSCRAHGCVVADGRQDLCPSVLCASTCGAISVLVLMHKHNVCTLQPQQTQRADASC